MSTQRPYFAFFLATTALTAIAPQTSAQEQTAQAGEQFAQRVDEILVTARRRSESLQDVPIAIAVITADTVADTGAYNVNRLTQLQPSLQFYSQNPRNSAVNIRGFGAPLGLTNDGIEQGVGIYVDQVYYNRVASATLDFVDIEQIEVLRGPQGTLYGKNTTAGAINITTRKPSFEFEGKGEFSVGNYNFTQAKASISGPLSDKVAARIGISNTDRRGTIYNVKSNQWIQSQDNFAIRGSVLWTGESVDLTVSGDYNLQDANCCGQIYVGTHPTQRPLNRQYAALTSAFNYAPPSTDPFDRLTDLDAQLNARNEIGGASVRAEADVAGGTLTSVTAWRYWDWGPANDRDFTGLPITTASMNPTKQNQYTQEVRYAYEADRFDYVVGAFAFYQRIHTQGTERQGPAASRWTLAPTNALSQIPAVLDNLTANNDILLKNISLATFGKLNWEVTDAFTVTPGLRLNYDKKTGHYESVVTGTASNGTRQLVLFTGPFATDPWIVAQRGVRAPTFYEPNLSKWNLSYDLTLSYAVTDDTLAYGTYSKAFKSAGINLNGVPADAAGVPILAAATIRQENVDHFELGVKTQLLDQRATLNVTAFSTSIKDYQANVNNAALGLVRGYLANAGKVRARGIEADFNVQASDRLTAYVSGAYTDHEYVKFVDAPCAPELTGGGTGTPASPAGTPGGNSPANCNISGQWLPGISTWAGSWGAEANTPVNFLSKDGEVYFGYYGSYRSKFSSNASRSAYFDVAGYSLHNFRAGFRADDGFNIYLWVRNAFDKDYFEQLAVTPGSTGLIAGQPADPRTFGATVRFTF